MREPMVTRTMKTTEVSALTVNLETEQIENTTIVLPREYTTVKKLEKAIESAIDSTHKLVKVIKTTTVTKLYGMSESDFMKYASVLPERAVKANEQ